MNLLDKYDIIGRRGEIMANNLQTIKNILDQYIGKRIKITAEMGRNRIREREGVLKETYNSVFVIDLDSDQSIERVSYSYTDVLTKTVVVSHDNEELQLIPQ